MSTRLENWTVDSPFIKRRSRVSRSSRAQLIPGTYLPSADTVGPLISESAMATWSGSHTFSSPGVTVENTIFNNYVSVRAANITFRNCVFKGGAIPASGSAQCVDAGHGSCENLLLEDCKISPTNASFRINGISGHDYTLRRCLGEQATDICNVFNTAAPNTDSGVVIEGSWLRDLTFFWGTYGEPNPRDNQTHNDLIQIQGGHGTIIQGNRLDCYYSRTRGHAVPPYSPIPPADEGSGGTIPDRGTGTEATGRYNWGSLIAIQYNTNVGATDRTEVLDNWIYGSNIAVNAAINTSTTIGKIWRNQFSRDQGSQSTGGNNTWTITIRQGQTCDAGEGTSNRNTYIDNGAEVLVRRNVP